MQLERCHPFDQIMQAENNSAMAEIEPRTGRSNQVLSLPANHMVITFTEQELKLVAQNRYSNTPRDILCIVWVVRTIVQTAHARVQHTMIPDCSLRLAVKQAYRASQAFKEMPSSLLWGRS